MRVHCILIVMHILYIYTPVCVCVHPPFGTHGHSQHLRWWWARHGWQAPHAAQSWQLIELLMLISGGHLRKPGTGNRSKKSKQKRWWKKYHQTWRNVDLDKVFCGFISHAHRFLEHIGQKQCVRRKCKPPEPPNKPTVEHPHSSQDFKSPNPQHYVYLSASHRGS